MSLNHKISEQLLNLQAKIEESTGSRRASCDYMTTMTRFESCTITAIEVDRRITQAGIISFYRLEDRHHQLMRDIRSQLTYMAVKELKDDEDEKNAGTWVVFKNGGRYLDLYGNAPPKGCYCFNDRFIESPGDESDGGQGVPDESNGLQRRTNAKVNDNGTIDSEVVDVDMNEAEGLPSNENEGDIDEAEDLSPNGSEADMDDEYDDEFPASANSVTASPDLSNSTESPSRPNFTIMDSRFTDGILEHVPSPDHCTLANSLQLMRFLSKLQNCWQMEGRPPIINISLPDNYRLYITTTYNLSLYGHPSWRRFRSAKTFYLHFKTLVLNNGSNVGCECEHCQ